MGNDSHPATQDLTVRNENPANLVIPATATDSDIREMLAGANIPALLMALVHLTGDISILDEGIRPGIAGLGDEQGGIPEPQKEIVRKRAFTCT